MVTELVVPSELPVADKIHHMETRFCRAQDEAVKAKWDLNLQIIELRMKA